MNAGLTAMGAMGALALMPNTMGVIMAGSLLAGIVVGFVQGNRRNR